MIIEIAGKRAKQKVLGYFIKSFIQSFQSCSTGEAKDELDYVDLRIGYGRMESDDQILEDPNNPSASKGRLDGMIFNGAVVQLGERRPLRSEESRGFESCQRHKCRGVRIWLGSGFRALM